MFNRALLALPLALAVSAPAAASASTWKIDAAHSNVGFKVRHMMVSNVRGQFDKFSGTVELNDKDLTKSKVSVEIDTSSVNTQNDKRDDHLRGGDFFDAKKHPKMTFVSTSIKKSGDGYKVMGKLTLHGVTKAVTLDVEDFTGEVKDAFGNMRRGLSATTKINRKDFGLTWNKMLEAGGVAVGEEIKISLEIELTKG